MRHTIFQRAWYWDALPFLFYNGVTHFVFAPDPADVHNLIVTLGFTLTQLVAVYGILWTAVDRPGWRGWLLGSCWLLAGLLVAYPIFLVAGVLGPLKNSWNAYQGFLFPAIFWSVLMLVPVCLALHFYFRRRTQVQRTKELEQAKTTAELAYLRGQLNPHFLFNALNSIHVLIRHDPELAADSLAGFSDLLRYQLYRSEAGLVPLGEELDQIERFAELSLLRQEEDFRWQLNVAPGVQQLAVPPLLLQPLVENAFKHNTQFGGWATLNVDSVDNNLRIQVSNRTGVAGPADTDSGGIGLSNIRRRLDLLYGENYHLSHQLTDDIFTLKLQLPCTPYVPL